jgi:hypothetical protein
MKMIGELLEWQLLWKYIVGITIGSIASFASVEVRESLPAGLTGIVVWGAEPEFP